MNASFTNASAAGALRRLPMESRTLCACLSAYEDEPCMETAALFPPEVLAEMLRRRVLTLRDVSDGQKTLDACIAAVFANSDAIADVPDALQDDAWAGAAELDRWAYRAAVSAGITPAQMVAFLAARDAEVVPFAA